MLLLSSHFCLWGTHSSRWLREPRVPPQPVESDDRIISEPALVRAGSSGSLPAAVSLAENCLPSFFAYLANGPTFLSAPVECEGGRRRPPAGQQGPSQVAELRGLRGPRTPIVHVGTCVGGTGSLVSAPPVVSVCWAPWMGGQPVSPHPAPATSSWPAVWAKGSWGAS